MFHNSNKETILKEEIQENTLAIYLEDEPINYIPDRESGYTLDLTKSNCNNGATVSWNDASWSILVNFSNYQIEDISRTKCTLYFKKNLTAVDFVRDLADNSEELMYDETVDNNLRYIGADPNNYVWFNNELWRIIGVFNNIDNGSGTKETRLKIIRNKSIGNYSWDNKASGTGSSEASAGSNDWSDSALQIVLNSGAYYNRTSGSCPYGSNGATTACDFTSAGLTNEAKAMLSDAIWNLGGLSTAYNATTRFYTLERETTVCAGRPTSWTGKVALIYPSDYGYATSGGSIGRTNCLSYSLGSWNRYSDCYNNDWLYDSINGQWALTPGTASSSFIFNILSKGNASYTDKAPSSTSSVYPVTFLISNIKITGGTGEENNPFTLSL